jgi:predicted MFS family arabinose efflux permease
VRATKPNIVAAIALMVAGPIMFLLVPMYIGAIADSYDYAPGKLGLLASADLLGIMVASLFAPLVINRINWRLSSLLIFIGVISCNYLSVFIASFTALFCLRLFIGLLTGVVMAISASVLSYTSTPDRLFAIAVFTQVSFQTASFLILPGIIEQWLLEGFLYFVIGVQLLALPLLWYLPANLQHVSHTQELSMETRRSRRHCLVVLASMLFFWVAQAGVFSFVDMIGNDNGLDDQSVGLALSISTFIGLGGPLCAAICGDRFGRFWPVAIAGCVQIMVLALFESMTGLTGYTVLLALFQFFWTLVIGYQFGALVSADSSHRFVAVVPAASSAGIALGPLLGGYALEQGGHTLLYIVCGAALFIYMALLLPNARTFHHQPVVPSEN